MIAEIGVNHNGEPSLAHRLIDVAAETGADAVKFQTFDVALLVASDAATASYQRAATSTPIQSDLLEGLALPVSVWEELADHAAERGVIFLSTPFDLGSAQLLAELKMPALKVPSGELNNLPFLRALADLGLPMMVSTGMSDLDEVAAAVGACSAAPQLALFHCVSAYPAPPEDANLRAIPALKKRFDLPVGWSDHSLGAVTAVAAVAVGARLLEKHLTLDRSMSGPDHKASAGPSDLAAYIAAVREAERSMGDGCKRPMPSEYENRRLVRRSLHAARPLSAGTRVGPHDVVALRPATGLPPATSVVGAQLRRDVPAGKPLVAEDLEGFDPHEDAGSA